MKLKKQTFIHDISSGNEYSRSEVEARATAIADHLSDMPTGTALATMVTRPENVMAALLACWSRRLIPAVFEPDVPNRRFQLLNEKLSFATLLTDVEPAVEFERVTSLSDIPSEITPSKSLNVTPSDDPALLLFTSGSTGAPKHVPLSLNNIIGNVEALARRLDLTSDDRFLCTSPLHYAHGIFNSLCSAWFLGASVVHGGPLSLFSVAKVLKTAAELEVTVYHATPSMLTIMATAAKRGAFSLPSPRWVISGTDRLPVDLKDRFEKLFDVTVTQQYGMTESLIMTINDEFSRECPGSVGSPMGCEMVVRNPDWTETPLGDVGEITVKSAACFGEYLGQPEETLESFRDGWFRTGDLGRIDERGLLFVTGRAKSMIKKSGFNLNPNEIRDVLLRCPAVTEAVVVGVPDDVYGEEIAALLVLVDQRRFDVEAVRAYCRKELAPVKVPKHIFVTSRIPTNRSGKPDMTKAKNLVMELIDGE